jgi:hypothetical protein
MHLELKKKLTVIKTINVHISVLPHFHAPTQSLIYYKHTSGLKCKMSGLPELERDCRLPRANFFIVMLKLGRVTAVKLHPDFLR